ncbi:hypothetical protein OBBRIDRAFT_802959 [Obba rivulosa]|uniref:DUF6534 domain-containing protein n=1 Tax=Obba rivulosa TaxID=1052685 RepID=A0A8E2B409_9APHY|nr:hypothetical protein OBBRIDRAFT_802959 [Obba rivulosa]
MSSGLHLDSTLGSAFLGHFLSTALFGVTSVQTWTYFKKSYQDSRTLNSLDTGYYACGAPYLFNILLSRDKLWQSCRCGEAVLDVCCTYGRSLFNVITVELIVTSGSDNSYRSCGSSGPTMSLIMVYLRPEHNQYDCARTVEAEQWRSARANDDSSGSTVPVHLRTDFVLTLPTYFLEGPYVWSLYAAFSVEILADSLITIAQYLYLRRFRSGVKSNKTDSIIHVVTVYSINTCLITSICGILCLVTYAALPDTFVYWPFYFILGKPHWSVDW